MDKQMLLQMISALPDDQILKMLSMGMKGGGINGGPGGHDMSQWAPDPSNKLQGMSGINIMRGPEDRPKIADKDYIIKKLALGSGQEMPHDEGNMGSYARPF